MREKIEVLQVRDFTEEQQMLRQAYRKFLETELVPHMPRFREQGIVDREIFHKACQQGFLMIWPDQKYGGMGDKDFRFEQVIIEENVRAGTSDWFATLCLFGPLANTKTSNFSAATTIDS